MTDQELNEWVADRIMGWRYGMAPSINMFNIAECEEFDAPYASYPFLPCKLLDHTHLMEEKIREMGRDGVYVKMLWSVLNINPFQVLDTADCFKFIHASARQRCEAAWLTFNK